MPRYLKSEISEDAVWGTTQDVERRYRISRAKQYKLIGLKLIEARKMGSRTLISLPSVDRYLASLPAAQIKPPKHIAA